MRISDWSADVCSSDLPRPNAAPGSGYPAAGPLPKLAAIWRKGAPSIDFLAPAIHFPNFVEWTQAYAVLGAPWFIPEANQAGAAQAPHNALYAFGSLGAFCSSPFSLHDRQPADEIGPGSWRDREGQVR